MAIPAPGGFYRAVWRWHFYAGLIVLPMLLWLAATGALYLYKPEIERWIYGGWTTVVPAGPVQPLAILVPAIERRSGGRVTQVTRPAIAGESWRATLDMPDGARRLAFADPYRARLLGTVAGGGVMATVKDLHSLAITGPIGNALVEIVAGWGVVLVMTGVILWWPRGGSPAIGVRGRPRARVFWRDLHASVGVLAAAVILFLAVTGMPWTLFAGAQLNAWFKSAGLGRPAAPAAEQGTAPVEDHSHHGGETAGLPWSMQHVPIPRSGTGHATPDLAADRADWMGIGPAWTMTLPSSPGTPFTVSATIARAEDAHVVRIDAADGRVLQDARYRDFGIGARTIEWGIATHQGQQYGEANRLLMLAGCIAIWVLGLTGTIAWWKRRRHGRLRAPPPALDRRRTIGVAGAMLALGALFPLTGLTMLAALTGEGLLALVQLCPTANRTRRPASARRNPARVPDGHDPSGIRCRGG